MIELPVKNTAGVYAVNPSKIICLGLNYHDHIKESISVQASGGKTDIPAEPVLFNKTPNTLIGPDEAIVIPAFLQDYNFPEPRVDLEGELALVISKKGRNIPPEKAYEYVLGYTCLNDVSQRNLQTTDKSGWYRGKSLDTFGPVGPVLVLASDLADPMNLVIESRLNGRTVQKANTSMMIFHIPAIIAFISRNFTLNPGDIISTGTPAGVTPIQPGDIVEVEVEGIGILRNPVTAEP